MLPHRPCAWWMKIALLFLSLPLAAQPKLWGGKGAVQLVMTSNTAQVGRFEKIHLRCVEGNFGSEEVLTQQAPGLSRDTSLFTGQMRPGSYILEKLEVGTASLTLSDGMKKLLGSFKVEDGAVSDLGRIVLTAVGEKVILGRSSLVTSNEPFLSRFAPKYQYPPAVRRIPGWNAPMVPEDRVEAFAQRYPVGLEGVTELADGTVVAASRMGTILMRDPQKGWRSIRTGRLESLLCLSPQEGAETFLVAGGEFNTLLRVSSLGALEPLDPGNLPPGNILHIDGNDTAGWILAHQTPDAVTFYRSPRLEKAEWKVHRVHEFRVRKYNDLNSLSPERFWFWTNPDGFGYLTTRGSAWIYERKPGTWLEAPRLNDTPVMSLAPMGPPNEVSVLFQQEVTLGGRPGFALSKNGGRYFGPIGTPGIVHIIRERYEDAPRVNGVAPVRLPNGTLLSWCHLPIHSQKLILSADNGATWTAQEQVFLEGSYLRSLPKSGLFAIADGTHSKGESVIYHSDDGGKTWKVEFSNSPRF